MSAATIPTLEPLVAHWKTRLQTCSVWFIQPGVLIRVVLYLTTLIYLRTVLFDYIYDDNILITLNPQMESWRLIPSFFTHSFWSYLEIPRVVDYYRPLVMVVLAAVYHLLGPAPGWFHLVAAGLHILATYLVFRLTIETLGNQRVAAVAAGIFGLHPTKVQTAAWISGISDSLSAVFFLAAMIAYFSWRQQKRNKQAILWTSTLFLLLALFSKEAAVFAPALVAVFEFMATKTDFRDRFLATLRSVWPFALITGLALTARIFLVRNAEARLAIPIDAIPTLLTAPQAILWYLGKQVWPVGLSVHYPIMVIAHPSFTQFVLPFVAVTTLGTITFLALRKSQIGIFLASWFVLMLAPPILYQTILQRQDRYFYFASVATSIGFAYVLVRLTRFRPVLQSSVVIVLFAILSTLTFRYQSYWDNDIALFTRAWKIAPTNPQVSEYLASQYVSLGRPEKAEQIARTIITDQNQPAEGWLILGKVRLSENRFEEASEAMKKSLQLSPHGSIPASMALASADLKLGKNEEAAQIYRNEIVRHPDIALLHGGLAVALKSMGRAREAADELVIQKQLQGE